jgi:hypothetical protein
MSEQSWLRNQLSFLVCGLARAEFCGHLTERWRMYTLFGFDTYIRPLRTGYGHIHYCTDCVADMAIPCAICGRAIASGDLVSAVVQREDSDIAGYILSNRGEQRRDAPPQLITCMYPSCSDTLADCRGQWVPDEHGQCYVHRFPSVYREAMLADSHAVLELK